MANEKIEVEVRSFLTDDEYFRLIDFFSKQCGRSNPDEQVTYYFDAPVDVRIQKNSEYSKIWLKKGKMHAEQREEIEIIFPKQDFEKLETMFLMLGYPVKVKWFRKRYSFDWKGLSVCVDSNKGYGNILEIERKTDKQEKDKALSEIKTAFDSLGIAITPKEVFDKRYAHYVANWKELTK